MPDGRTLPCHGATHITTLRFDSVRDRAASLDLGGVARLPGLPRRRLDAGALSELSAEGDRFRGMPLPGICLDGRCDQPRSGLHADAAATHHRHGRSGSDRPRPTIGIAFSRSHPHGHDRVSARDRNDRARSRLRQQRARSTRSISLSIAARSSASSGPNGAGKTTAMLLLATLLQPSRGRARIFGATASGSARRSVGAWGWCSRRRASTGC